MDGQVVRCGSCGQANRVPAIGSGKKAVCGKCGADLSAQRTPVDLTDATFDKEVEAGPMVVDFWAGWCGPCHMLAPVVAQLAAERTDVRFGKLNVDENPRTSSRFNVQSIPLLVFFKDGQERGRVVGVVPRGRIEQAITQFLG
jgi:thioredoxin 2